LYPFRHWGHSPPTPPNMLLEAAMLVDVRTSSRLVHKCP